MNIRPHQLLTELESIGSVLSLESLVETKNYRTLLSNEFELRKKKNTRYSLRAFARDLALEPSFLSKLLRGDREITEKMWQRISITLNTIRPEDDGFYEEHEVISEKDLGNFRWHHLYILECFSLSDFKFSIKNASAKTGLKEEIVRQSLDELVAMGFLQKNSDNVISLRPKNKGRESTTGTFPVKKMIESIFAQSLESLHKQDAKKRHHGTIIVATDPKKIVEAKRRTLEFHQELINFLEEGESRTELFGFCSSLFPVRMDF